MSSKSIKRTNRLTAIKCYSASMLEFAVEMTCKSCVDTVNSALVNVSGVQSVNINFDKRHVLVDTALPATSVQELIEGTGRKAVLLGIGVERAGTVPVVAAVAMVSGTQQQTGVVRFAATDDETCLIDGTVDGLRPGVQHSLRIHEYGDLSDGCNSCGDVLKGFSQHVSTFAKDQLNRAVATEKGRADVRFQDKPVRLWELIGRSVVLHEHLPDGSENRVACGIIARSSGLFQNSKRICACSGATLWDEREAART